MPRLRVAARSPCLHDAMELGNDLFEQIISALSGAREEVVPREVQDKRSEIRLAVSMNVAITAFGVASAQPREVQLRSLSRRGAAIVDSRIFQQGDKVVLYLPKANGPAVPIVCMVMNSRMRGGEFRVGLQFLSRAEPGMSPMLRSADGLVTHPMNEGSYDMLDAIAEGRELDDSGVDGREQRADTNIKAMLSPYPEGMGSNLSIVTVKDLSAGGVCIVQPEEMNRGEMFLLQIPRGSGKPLTMICTVIDCRRLDDSNFRIGARVETRLLPNRDEDDAPKGLIARFRRWFAA